MQHTSDNEQAAGNNEQQSLAETLEDELDCVVLHKMHGTSTVHKHMHLFMLKDNINTDERPIFYRILSDSPVGHVVCMIRKEQAKPLDKCLVKCTLGQTSNGTAHLQMHKKLLEAQEKAEAE